MEPRSHRAELELERRRDLLVGEAFEVTEDDDDPALLAELGDRAVKRRLQLGSFQANVSSPSRTTRRSPEVRRFRHRREAIA